MYICDLFTTEDDEFLKLIEATEEYLLSMHTPNNYNGQDPENTLLQQDKAFMKFCIGLKDNNIPDPANLSEFEIYSHIDYLEDKHHKKTQNQGAGWE